ncbi:MAG: YfhO family protein, partial [Firmicutes bacterium]|nr:YfhO family protein [Bacillota bacterium]
YRTVDLTNKAFNSNNIRDINEYKTTMYSSVTNKYYKDFYWNTFDTDNPNRNDAIYGDIANPLFNIYFGNRYLITKEKPQIGYTYLNSNDSYNLYQNKDVFSIGYANSKLMSEEEFNKLKYPYNIEALLNYTIVDEETKSNYKTNIKEVDLNKEFDNLKEKYNFTLTEAKKEVFKSKSNFSNQIVIIKFDMNYSESCNKGDTSITINNVKNVLTCSSWKYHNHNYSFTYVLSEPNTFDIEIEKGTYDISNMAMYTLNYNSIKDINNSHSNLIVYKKEANKGIIKGHINVKENSYFSLSIPYDKGYNIYVDRQKIAKIYQITERESNYVRVFHDRRAGTVA